VFIVFSAAFRKGFLEGIDRARPSDARVPDSLRD